MDTIVSLVAGAGFIGSIALAAWGMVLLLTHALGAARPVNADARWLHTNLPAGTSL